MKFGLLCASIVSPPHRQGGGSSDEAGPGLTPLSSRFAIECYMRTRKMRRRVRSTWAPLSGFWQLIDCRRPAPIKSAGPAHVSDAALEHDVEPLGVAVVVDAAVPELTFAQSLLDLSLEMQAQFQMQQSPEYPIAVALVGYGKWLLAFRAP